MSSTNLWKKIEQIPSGHLTWTKADQMHAAVSTFNTLIENGTITKGTKEYKIALHTIKILKTKIIKNGMQLDYSQIDQFHLPRKPLCLNKVH